ncbi:uncharacterized protein LOC109614199 [Musca domestica]|uniref:Uncharacterized protein LOC109614199 n=1 Tax=Musca domestica TaxID=7370 RepID=A0A9J7DMC7_MUSDO|nr:uncharacterized protein LOC109614199 [Musca domestica]
MLRSKTIITVPLDSEEENGDVEEEELKTVIGGVPDGNKKLQSENEKVQSSLAAQKPLEKHIDKNSENEREKHTEFKITGGVFGPVSINSPKKETQIMEKDKVAQLRDKQMELLRKENELLQKEKEIMQRENDFLKLMSSNIDRLRAVDNSVPLGLVSNFVPVYDGKADAAFFITQLRDLQQHCKLSDDLLRALFASKLEGRPLSWLHSRRGTATDDITETFSQFCVMFGSKKSRLELRRKFERRVWRQEENFMDYYNGKVELAKKLKMEEDELLEYVIDGISNTHLRRQTVLQHYNNLAELCKSLSTIKLPKAVDADHGVAANKFSVRCYNCNSFGHYAADCTKPTREPGTCYACGISGHTVGSCDKNKKRETPKNENNYKA